MEKIHALIDFDSIIYVASLKEDMDSAMEYILSCFHKIEEKLEFFFNYGEDCFAIQMSFFYKRDAFSIRKNMCSEYKKQRKEKPQLYSEIVEYLSSDEFLKHLPDNVNMCPVYIAETDDVVAFAAASLNPLQRVIATIDKDLMIFEGWVFDLYHKRFEISYITKQDAMKNAVLLLLSGDKSDNVKGVTSQSVAKGITQLHKGFALKRQVVNLYKKKYKANWKQMLRKKIFMLLPLLLLDVNCFNFKTYKK